MRGEAFGKLIRYERKKRKISIEKLVRGLCSQTTLKKIESGERTLDFFVIKRVVERLGISPNKFDILQDERCYRFVLLREKIEELLDKGLFNEVESGLNDYEQMIEPQEFLQKQYVLMVRGIVASERDKNHGKAKDFFKQALDYTVKDFLIENLESYSMGEDEFILFLLYLKELELIGEIRIKDYGNEILRYIETIFKDEEIRVNLYSKADWMVGESFLSCNEEEEALQIFLKGEEIVTKNGLLIHLSCLLERIVELAENRNQTLYLEYKKMKDALRTVYNEFSILWNEKPKLWKTYKANGAFLISEFIREERLVQGISQESLAESLDIDVKTISRIERGKARPKAGTLKRICDFLGVSDDFSSARIVTDDFELIELDREITKLLVYYKYDVAGVLYNRLKNRLSKEIKENRQYITFMDFVFERQENNKSDKEFIVDLMEALSITRGINPLKSLGEYVPRRIEAMIISNLAICYQRVGQPEKAIELLEKLIAGYEKSKVSQRLNYASLSVLYANLAIFYEENERFLEGILLSDKAIQYSFSCMRGEYLGEMLQEKTYTQDRMSGDRSKSKEKYSQSYQLMKLMRVCPEKMTVLQNAFKSWYYEEMEL